MTSDTRARRVRTIGLAVVMLGALSVSVRGQVEAVRPLLDWGSIVLALTNDIAALLALNEVVSTSRSDVRRWAWAVLLLAGGTAAGLNTWHALAAQVLPPVWAIVVGAGPVLLSMVLSHLMALASTEEAPTTSTTSDPRAEPTRTAIETAHVDTAAVLPAEAPTAPAAGRPADDPRVDESPAGAADPLETAPETARSERDTTSRDGQVMLALLDPGTTHRALAVVPSSSRHVDIAAGDQPSTAATSPDERVAALVVQLRTGAVLTGAEVGEQLDCSARTGRRLLRQAEAQLEAESSTAENEESSSDVEVEGTGPSSTRSNPDMATTSSKDGPRRDVDGAAPVGSHDVVRLGTGTG